MLKTYILDYLTICKPRVVVLMLITAWVGMYLAADFPYPYLQILYASVGITLAAASAAVLNHLLDRKIDILMSRTAHRPIACNRISSPKALIFATILSITASLILFYKVNSITAVLTIATFCGYALIYTLYLKHATPQNIVIGGLSGAMPPLLGWSAISADINPQALLLVLIIFIWTPAHFWALAIYRVKDYAKAQIPMLPVTHGIRFTKLCILLYTILLCVVSTLPFVMNMSGGLYLSLASILNLLFLYFVLRLYSCTENKQHAYAIQTFNYSIVYLLLLFISLILDHHYGTRL